MKKSNIKRLTAMLLIATLLLGGCSPQSDTSSDSTLSAVSSETADRTVEAENSTSDDNDSNTSGKTENASKNDTSDSSVSETEEALKEADLKDLDFAADVDDSDQIQEFKSLSDPRLTQYIEDTVYVGLKNEFPSEDYIIDNVSAVYISEDYLEEFAYNSKANIFFGYTLEELDQQFKETPYVFTLGDDGNTTVVPMEDYDDTYEKIIKNVATGGGVILVCTTVSIVTAGVGLMPVSVIFAVAADTGTSVAISAAAYSALFAGVSTGLKTKDFSQTAKAVALAGSYGVKWGAIGGAILGGLSASSILGLNNYEALLDSSNQTLYTGAGSKWQQAEQRALDRLGGSKQVSYLNGKEVPMSTPGATRPDVVRTVGDHIEAVEVKYYDLANPSSRSQLYSELERQVTDRVANLPPDATQRIVLDVTDRGFSAELVNQVVETIQLKLGPIYSNIPIDVVGL